MTHPPSADQPTAAGTERASAIGLFHQFRETFRAVRRPTIGHGRLLLATGIAAAVLAFAGSFLLEPEYESTFIFFVDKSSAKGSLPTGLAGLGQSLGINLEDMSVQPLRFYAWLAESSPVLTQSLFDTVPEQLRWRVLTGSEGAILWAQFARHPAVIDSIALAKEIRELQDRIRSDVDEQTSLVSVTTSAPTARLATWFATKLFRHVNDANTIARQTRAGNEARFLQARLSSAAQNLDSAGRALKSFYEANRRIQESPTLQFEESRLKRAIDVADDAYLSLAHSLQDAQLRAVRDVPALTLIDGPTYPIRRSSPRRLVLTLLALILGAGLAYTRLWWRMAQFEAR